MIKRYFKIKKIILPSKRINLFIMCILFLGVGIGAIYACTMGSVDLELVHEKLYLFLNNINDNTLKTMFAFRNSISINLSYIFVIWLFGMSLIGIIFGVFLLFFKSFILGFSIASFIITFGFKGIILSILYLCFGQLINIVILMFLTIYSLMFGIKLFLTIFKKDNYLKMGTFFKSYVMVLLISIVISLISSLSEAFLLPSLLKLIIKLYI